MRPFSIFIKIRPGQIITINNQRRRFHFSHDLWFIAARYVPPTLYVAPAIPHDKVLNMGLVYLHMHV